MKNTYLIKRALIFFFYDEDGVVDEYVVTLLNGLKKNVETIIIVCNGELNSDGRNKLSALTNNLFVRENEGFDVWAYKYGIECLGWDKLNEYDELLMMNFTVFGPLYPFSEMFDKMDKEEVDFWGINKHHEILFDPFGMTPDGVIPEHIQSHFIAIRRRMFSSDEFKRYWKTMRHIESYEESICYHEIVFTKTFADKGFSWSVYIDTDDLKEFTANPLMTMPLELIKNRRCPIVKRRSLFLDYRTAIAETLGEAAFESFEFIAHNLDYDINLIWDNILRTQNQYDIKNNLHLNYILPDKFSTNTNNSILPLQKTALFMHIYYFDLIDYCFEYAKSLPENVDVYITTTTEKNRRAIINKFSLLNCNKLTVIVIENRGRDVSSLLVALREFAYDYDLICHAHDKKSGQDLPRTIGVSWSYQCFENILKSREYVNNIIQMFADNPRMGMAFPPPPIHGVYSQLNYWTTNFAPTTELAEKLNINVPFDINKDPIAPLGGMFWFRPTALKPLLDYPWKYENFPQEPISIDGTILHAIERLYSFVAQERGYYAAWLMTETFAKMEITNLAYLFSGIKQQSLARSFGWFLKRKLKQYPWLDKFIRTFYPKIRLLKRGRR
jgi:lipopolysaccharide biosynthesis protein